LCGVLCDACNLAVSCILVEKLVALHLGEM
jgi:hypothetical protein